MINKAVLGVNYDEGIQSELVMWLYMDGLM